MVREVAHPWPHTQGHHRGRVRLERARLREPARSRAVLSDGRLQRRRSERARAPAGWRAGHTVRRQLQLRGRAVRCSASSGASCAASRSRPTSQLFIRGRTDETRTSIRNTSIRSTHLATNTSGAGFGAWRHVLLLSAVRAPARRVQNENPRLPCRQAGDRRVARSSLLNEVLQRLQAVARTFLLAGFAVGVASSVIDA